jgi:exodeoxyribonuclease-3
MDSRYAVLSMKIASWNVNSVRARTPQLLHWLSWSKPDVVCLQELKCEDKAVPVPELQAAGYQVASHGQRTYNGVAILARNAITDVVCGLSDGVEDDHARFISGVVDGVRVISIYAPNGQSLESPAYPYKLAWYERLRRYLDAHHTPTEPLVICGDYNVARDDRDLYDPAGWAGGVLVSDPERAAVQALEDFGLVDTFRKHHQEGSRYSWWDYRQLAFPRNNGLRIDYVFASPPLAERCTEAGIDRDTRKGEKPSDHAPVWAIFTD